MPQHSTALIVGANRGIGLGVVREYLSRGVSVIATARNPGAAAELRALAQANPGRVDIRALDMNDGAQIDAFAATLPEIDVALVNAGVSGPDHRTANKASAAEIGALMFVNAIAPTRLARHLMPTLRDGGVLAFTVSQRTQEIGIRMALGAGRGAVLWMVLRQGLGLVILGLALGTLAAFFLSQVITQF